MEKILVFLAKETKGTCYKSFKYCFESIEVPTVVYDDKQKIVFSGEKSGETDKGLKTSKSLSELAKRLQEEGHPLFRYFLDGSRRAYKVDDIAYGNRLYPVIAGQIGVGCCERREPDSFKVALIDNSLTLSLPACANKDNVSDELFFNALISKINALSVLKTRNIVFQKILHYSDSELKEDEKYEHKGIAKIQDEMIEAEKRLVYQLVQERKLNFDAYLLKDGSIEYQKMKSGDLRDLAAIKTNYQCVVGVSKSFNPELCRDSKGKSIAKSIADLPLFHRTPAYKYTTDRTPGVEFSVWYLRIREVSRTVSPFDGVVKVEKILITDDEQKRGLNSEEIDRISANLINERNPTCYGADHRWANHLYPVFLTESYIKSQYLSDVYFLHLF
ncbi:hypothetical protein U27_06281 [Candidatus Vecturithrix granuli]|uniref:NurA domain-containing protein n=1 Tax=Vecturithrix granuli TaxID=1499967 RepID=A0A081C3Z9_VECG1|nr:hypothetical protein U27_06281 [Candidatus Vecturithrix granuli]